MESQEFPERGVFKQRHVNEVSVDQLTYKSNAG